ncbi:MAG TPA: HAD hydrolase family protein [Limnochordales bacterium]
MSSTLGTAGSNGRFRLVALDIDDTLLGLDQRLSPRDVAAVRRCREAGIEVILATGRTRQTTMPVARAIADDLPMICTTGGVTYDGAGRVLRRLTVPLALAQFMLRQMQAAGVRARVDAGDVIYYTEDPGDNAYAPPGVVAPDLADRLAAPPDQIIVWGEAECRWVIRHFSYLDGAVQLLVLPSHDNPRVIHILHPLATKGHALAEYCASRGIDRRQVLAMGDSLNDFSLLSFAGMAVAMGHSDPRLHLVADVVLKKGETVADALEAWVFQPRSG